MLPIVERIQEPPMFLKNMLFSRNEKSSTKEVHFDKYVERELLATYNEKTNSPNFVPEQRFSVNTFEPPYISELKETSAVKLLDERMRGAIPPGWIAGQQNVQALADQRVAMDLAELKRRVWRRIEHQCMEMLTTGKVTVSTAPNSVDNIDFGLPATHAANAATVWDDADADPVADAVTADDLIQKDSQYHADVCVMDIASANAWKSNAAVLARLDNRRIFENEQVQRRIEKGALYLGKIDNIEYYQYSRFYENAAGTKVRYWPDNTAVFFNRSARAATHFGAIYNIKVGAIQTDIFPNMIEKDLPSRMYVTVESAPVAAHYELESVYVMTTLGF
jgi:hypothetical protein